MEMLLLIGVVFVWGIKEHLTPKDKKGRAFIIQYDERDKKRLLGVAVAVTVVQLFVVLGMLLASEGVLAVEAGDFCMFLSLATGFLTFVVWLVYFECLGYLKRLKRNGYEVPGKKKDYNMQVCNLPRKEGILLHNEINRESVVLAVLCWLVAAGVFITAIGFWLEYQVIKDMVKICMVLFGIMFICWMVIGYCYWIQRLNSKYRDDVNIQSDLKIRVHFLAGFTFILAMILVSNLCVLVMDQGIQCVCSAREQAQLEEEIDG
ncbi:MAG: hypothetical protein E7292_02465 [Lachnospiraceae bacterium]|nr:hypothetical protein [Lachnospiraceae bacterium]